MEVVRGKEVVRQYHYDARNHEWEKEHGVPKTNISVTFRVMEKNVQEKWSGMLVLMQFIVVQEEFVISGLMTQGVQVHDRVVDEDNNFSDEEKRQLAAPLFDMINRLTYEVTEVALDKPGIELGL